MAHHSGACLCGRVTFEIAGEFDSFYLCHCSRCRRASGSAHGANLFTTRANLTWLSGEDEVKTFRLAGTRHQRCFCQTCGSALPVVQRLSQDPGAGALIVVPAGSLSTPPGLSPTAHICCESRASWDQNLQDVPCFDHLPGATKKD